MSSKKPFAEAISLYTVAVRALCEFTAKEGDLDLRFTPAPSALEGIAGHKIVTSRRAPEYESEITLSGDFQRLRVRGRADGYDPSTNRLEEIKTHRGRLDQMPSNHRQLHWAQAKIYGCLLCRQRSLSDLSIALVYFDIVSQEETMLEIMCSATELEAFFAPHCERFLRWAENEITHRRLRNNALTSLQFPHTDFRPGQRLLAESVYRSANGRHRFMAQAPTGIGKTMGTIFPSLKAMPGCATDKLFFLTAKTSGQEAALNALARLCKAAPILPLRIIEIVARSKSCEYPDKACHGDSCPLASGFYDRIAAARAEALQIFESSERSKHCDSLAGSVMLTRNQVRSIALSHQVCPYYLTQELARWADVVIADYNYYFDSSAMLFALASANDWHVQVLVDEAHNLVERGRGMYSASLSQAALHHLQSFGPGVLRAPINAFDRRWQQLDATRTASYMVLPAVTTPFRAALQEMLAAMGDYLAEAPAGDQNALLAFYFEALRFARLVDSFGAHSIFDVSETAVEADADRILCIRNIVPAVFLKPRIAAAQAITLFSATLGPQRFYRDMLGMPDDTIWVDVPSPFIATQLRVQIVDRISTRFVHRQRSLPTIVELMAQQFADAAGNYLAFFSSFEYLVQVYDLFIAAHPHISVWKQSPLMNDAARTAFLARFAPGAAGIGFAVLGGAFSEGVDLPGDRLIGAFIATLGLPQLNAVNEQMMRCMETTFAAGYDYTYLYPGIRKVVQAAGRVIRTQEDRGVVYLIDDRFARPEVRALLPSWWEVEFEAV